MSSKVEVAVRSDMGCVRKNNEDNFGYDPANGLYVVCDGMGGVAAGEVASAIACSTIISTYAAQPAETPVHTRLALSIHSANAAVRHAAQEEHQHGMGTTLVCAVVDGSKLLVGNVGDSRAYLFQNSATMQLTVDHSYINELVRQGAVRVEDIHTVNLKGMESVITRAIGAAHDVEPDFFKVDLKPKDTLLLASDGLTRYVDSGRLVSLVDTADLEGSCERLIEAAKAAGGADNITCLLLRYDEVADDVTETAYEAPLVYAPLGTAYEAPSMDAAAEESALVEAAPAAFAGEEPTRAEAPVEAAAPEHVSEEPAHSEPLIPLHVIEDLEFESPLNAFVDEFPEVEAAQPETVPEEPPAAEVPSEPEAAPAVETADEEPPPALPVAWEEEPEAPKHAEVPVSFEDLLDGEETKH